MGVNPIFYIQFWIWRIGTEILSCWTFNRNKLFRVYNNRNMVTVKKSCYLGIVLLLACCLSGACEHGRRTLEETSGIGQDVAKWENRVDTDSVSEKESARVYHVEYWDSTQYDLEQVLLRGKEREVKSYAEGPQTISAYGGKPEYLNRYDGGASFFGKKGTSIDGGFSYRSDAVWEDIEEYSAGVPKWDMLDEEGNDRYGSEDLAFASLSQTEENVAGILADWDLQVQILEAYSLNLSAQEAIYKEKQELLRNLTDEGEEPELTEPYREGYLLLMTQTVDEIPLIPYFYTGGRVEYQEWLQPNLVSVWVTEDGIAQMYAENQITVRDTKEQLELITYEEALALLEEQQRTKQYGEHTVLADAGLFYVGIPEETGGFALTPCWCFCLIWENHFLDATTGQMSERTEITYELFHAATGERLLH